MLDDSGWEIFYRGLRAYLGERCGKAERRAMLNWRKKNRWPKHCAGCGNYTPNSQRTIDHIVPVSVCVALELPGLVYDENNYQMLCIDCNQAKRDKIDDLPEPVKQKLRERNELLGSPLTI